MVAVDLHACQIVSTPEWNDGEPVRVQAVHPVYGGRVAVRYQDARCRCAAQAVVVPVGMELTLISGGCIGGA
ncbi:hypothetical protein [Nonomuraea lactucae]|uniref:hypothetical protein n=1 Tax=Nonomuraea lactucae TaxID=2249762 RepID=UPI000DE3C113|nr:hypothetical protein [Nonomuraea lactucae]